MDNLTHSLVGAVMGQAGLKRKTGLAMPALIIGANLPDVDAACFFWLEGSEHLGFRRGITHGPPAMVLLPLVLAGLLWGWDRWQTKRGKRPEDRLPVHFGWLYALSFIGCLSHPALDWLNVYGVRFLEPFSSQWFYGDTLFIIDVWLWALLAVTTWWSLRSEKRGGNWKRPARIGSVIGLAYIALNGIISLAAPKAIYEATTISSPVPLKFWEREVIVGDFGTWFVLTDEERVLTATGAGDTARNVVLRFSLRPIADDMCRLPELSDARRSNSELDAFMFWTRAPFATRHEDGGTVLHDARFYDPLARDRFSVVLPDVECEELPVE